MKRASIFMGGTSASSQPEAQSALGLGTANSVQHLEVQVGATGDTGNSAPIVINVQGDGNAPLLRFDIDRPWEFRSNGTGSSSSLELKPTTASKSFEIRDNESNLVAEFHGAENDSSRIQLLSTGSSGNVGIGINYNSAKAKLHVSGNVHATSEITSDTYLAAPAKYFDIPHPTKEDKRLIHAATETNNHDVYYRGVLNNTNIITLPDYFWELVYEDSVTVHLTCIGDNLLVPTYTIVDKQIICNRNSLSYIVYGTRKDIPLLAEEIDA